jgi:hypothetical protein
MHAARAAEEVGEGEAAVAMMEGDGGEGSRAASPLELLLGRTKRGDVLSVVSVSAPYPGFSNVIESATMQGLMVLR